jgi:hypothetical protein
MRFVHFFIGCCLFLFLCLAVALPVYSQAYQSFNSQLEEVKRNTRWQVGPFRLYPVLRFRDIGYDNNVYYQREEDSPVTDFTATISPQISVNVLYRDWMILSLVENPEYVFFAEQKREGGLNNSITPSIKLNLFYRFVLTGEYFYRKARRRASSEFDVRANEETQRAKGQFFYETPRKTSLGVTAQIERVRYENTVAPGTQIYLSRALDRTERTMNFELYYRVFAESFLFFTGGYTDYEFENTQSRWRDSYSYQFYSGIRFPLLGRVTGTFSFGYKRLLPKAGYKKRFSGYVGNTNLDISLGRFDIRLRYNKDCQFSFWTENAFFVEHIYGAGLSFYLLKFLRLDYDFTYGDNQYPEETLMRLPDESYLFINRRDQSYTHSVGFVVRLIRNIGIGLRGNFRRRESNDYRWGDRERWFMGGYLTYEF